MPESARDNFHRHWLWICPTIFAITDATLTLSGQTTRYWAGHFNEVRELNPIGRILLEFHPFAFAAGILAWIVLFSILILYFKRFIAKWITLSILIAHAFGAATWLYQVPNFGILVVIDVTAARLMAIPFLDNATAMESDPR